MSWYEWAPYVSVGERRRMAATQIEALKRRGRTVSPVVIVGRVITRTFWGKAWCNNLESYSDYVNRLPRGRSYVRNGAVIDLKITAGKITALVQGTELYSVTIAIRPVEPARWEQIVAECSGKIDSVVELLQGKLSGGVMAVLTREGAGLFPSPRQMSLRCSCPDDARMCKHIAAALYGVGARLDEEPDLLFQLCNVDPTELVATAAKGVSGGGRALAKEKQLGADLASLFGIELEGTPEPMPEAGAKTAAARKTVGVARDPRAPAKRGAAKGARAAAAAPAVKEKARGSRRAGRGPSKRQGSITSTELVRLGVPQGTRQYWLKTGVLLRTGERGVYLETPRTRERLEFYRVTAGAARTAGGV